MSETLVRVPLALDAAAQDLLFREARTPNTFSSEPVSDEQLRAIYELIKWAPTAFNAQPLRVVLVRSEAAKARLLPHLFGSNAEKARSAPLVAILAADMHFHEKLPRIFPQFPIAKGFFDGDDRLREESAVQNALLQAGYFLLGIRAAGLAAGPQGGFDEDAVNKEFFGDGRHRALIVVNIGKPGENAFWDRNPRLGYDEVVTTL